MSEKKMMLGNAAIARGVWEAGAKVSSAYPGTPSTEISEELVKYPGVYAEWAPNEKVAAEVAIGASISGVRSFCTMKMVGLNVAADPLYSFSYIGCNGGLVAVVADDPGLYSSQNEQDTRMVCRAAAIPCMEPADSQEAKDYRPFEVMNVISDDLCDRRYECNIEILIYYIAFIFAEPFVQIHAVKGLKRFVRKCQ